MPNVAVKENQTTVVRTQISNLTKKELRKKAKIKEKRAKAGLKGAEQRQLRIATAHAHENLPWLLDKKLRQQVAQADWRTKQHYLILLVTTLLQTDKEGTRYAPEHRAARNEYRKNHKRLTYTGEAYEHYFPLTPKEKDIVRGVLKEFGWEDTSLTDAREYKGGECRGFGLEQLAYAKDREAFIKDGKTKHVVHQFQWKDGAVEVYRPKRIWTRGKMCIYLNMKYQSNAGEDNAYRRSIARKAAHARSSSLTPAERTAIASKAAKTRWKKARVKRQENVVLPDCKVQAGMPKDRVFARFSQVSTENRAEYASMHKSSMFNRAPSKKSAILAISQGSGSISYSYSNYMVLFSKEKIAAKDAAKEKQYILRLLDSIRQEVLSDRVQVQFS